ncbi:hypothetical protein GUJ93_ZPchr0008g12154 [Zizania palustris]|uniref:Uncharacterized protein n=1 Tax=Zizania palustris TaxID=103762 RepID=A0A8J5VHV0_ZIZPA|nr:hypothetical protein GUJ93_ZPchr0008g12154 [Zizania palustris]
MILTPTKAVVQKYRNINALSLLTSGTPSNGDSTAIPLPSPSTSFGDGRGLKDPRHGESPSSCRGSLCSSSTGDDDDLGGANWEAAGGGALRRTEAAGRCGGGMRQPTTGRSGDPAGEVRATSPTRASSPPWVEGEVGRHGEAQIRRRPGGVRRPGGGKAAGGGRVGKNLGGGLGRERGSTATGCGENLGGGLGKK